MINECFVGAEGEGRGGGEGGRGGEGRRGNVFLEREMVLFSIEICTHDINTTPT